MKGKKGEAPPRAALYARVSTDEQNPGMQKDALLRHATAKGWAFTYHEDKEHGDETSRVELDRVMQLVRERRVDVVLVWSFGRFGRTVLHLLRSLDEMTSKGVAFESLTEGLDPTTDHGRFAFTILGAVFELELARIRKNTRAGVARAIASGKKWGRPQRWTEDQVCRAAMMRKESPPRSWRKIAQAVGLPVRTIRRAVQGG